MSKSKGNVVDPFQQMERYGVDSMRFFLLREGSLQQDGGHSTLFIKFVLMLTDALILVSSLAVFVAVVFMQFIHFFV